MSLFQTSFSHSLPLITLLPKAPENDILNAFKENEAPIFLEKGKKTPILDIIELEASPEKNLYFYNDVSISNPNLANLIENYLKGIPPNDQELQQLNDVEKDLFRCIRNKKIWTDEERNENKLLEKKMKKCGKRMEESQKLFFKKAYAFLEGIFFRNQMKNKKKIQKRHKNYSEFYYYYFAETAKRMDIDIENFYHPHK